MGGGGRVFEGCGDGLGKVIYYMYIVNIHMYDQIDGHPLDRKADSQTTESILESFASKKYVVKFVRRNNILAILQSSARVVRHLLIVGIREYLDL